MLPRLAPPPSKVRCKNVALVVLTVALLCTATAIVTMTVSSTSSDAPSSVPSTTSRQEASCQVHDLRADFKRVNVAWNFTGQQDDCSSISRQATVPVGRECEFVCSHGFRDTKERKSDVIECKQDGKWDLSRTGPQACNAAPTRSSSPTVSPSSSPTSGARA